MTIDTSASSDSRFSEEASGIEFSGPSEREPQVTIDDVRTGHFFVCEKKGLVREITADPDHNGNVQWRSYWLDGRPTGDSLMCSVAHIVHWADREATAQEVARMQRHEAAVMEDAKVLGWLNRMLENAPDEYLLAEIRRRGYDVVRR